MPVPLQRLVSPPKHAEGYCAATRGEKGLGWLMRWLPSLAHDNGTFVVFSNGVGVDDDEIPHRQRHDPRPTLRRIPRHSALSC